MSDPRGEFKICPHVTLQNKAQIQSLSLKNILDSFVSSEQKIFSIHSDLKLFLTSDLL